jgi:hypothetical protein
MDQAFEARVPVQDRWGHHSGVLHDHGITVDLAIKNLDEYLQVKKMKPIGKPIVRQIPEPHRIDLNDR